MKYLNRILTLLLLLTTLTATAQQEIQQLGCRRGTPRPQQSKLLRAAQQRQCGGDYYIGERHQLVVLAEFQDFAFEDEEAATTDKWDLIMNAENFSEEPYKGSVHDYFYAQSYGKFNLIFDLQYVKLPGGREKYASNAEDDEKSQFLVYDIMDILQERDIDWSLYDWNADGFVNQLLIVYAGMGMNNGGDSNTIWAHQWWLSEHDNLSTDDPDDYCEPVIIDYNDKTFTVDCYCAVPEKGRSTSSFGTLCHEYTHCFGFPDFYNGTRKFVGQWDLMDYGNYNGDGYVPCDYSAHERWQMGWLTPKELTESTKVEGMPALGDKPTAYLIRNDGYENEYYIVENRQKSGWDAELPGSGIVIFHVNFDPDLWASAYGIINTSDDVHYSIIPANNMTSVTTSAGWPYPYDGNDELTNTSTPAAKLKNKNVDGSYFMNKSVTEMAVTDGLASFVFGENYIRFPELLNKVTFYHGTRSYILPQGITASVVTEMTDDGKLVCEKIVDQTLRDGITPCKTPMILTREDTSLPTVITLKEATSTQTYEGPNLLQGSDEDCMTDIYGTDYLFYKLALGHSASEYADIYSWYWGEENGAAFLIGAHKAWLALPKTDAPSRLSMIDSSELTSIRETGIGIPATGNDIYYDLSGRRVLYPKKGIFIQNGRKIVIR